MRQHEGTQDTIVDFVKAYQWRREVGNRFEYDPVIDRARQGESVTIRWENILPMDGEQVLTYTKGNDGLPIDGEVEELLQIPQYYPEAYRHLPREEQEWWKDWYKRLRCNTYEQKLLKLIGYIPNPTDKPVQISKKLMEFNEYWENKNLAIKAASCLTQHYTGQELHREILLRYPFKNWQEITPEY